MVRRVNRMSCNKIDSINKLQKGIQFLNAEVVRYSPSGTWSVDPNWVLTAATFVN